MPNPADTHDVKLRAFVGPGRRTPFDAPHPPLAADRVRHVGEPVAMVIAETAAAAQDAAERVVVRYAVLSAVTDALAALAPGAPVIHDAVAGNLALETEFGDRAAVEAACAEAALVVTQTFRAQRVASAHMEPRAALAAYDAEQGLLTVHTASQGALRIKSTIAACLGLPPERVRVVTGDVGGAFGLLSNAYCEQVMVAFAACHLGRPVKWTNSRSDAFLTDYQGRDLAIDGRLALAADGRILAYGLTITGNIGAHPVTYVPLSNASRVAPTVYDIPHAAVTVRAAVTNTVPTAPFRGAGRPEATFAIERLIDIAARRLGLDRVAIRRRNLIRRTQLPYRSATGLTYDSGNFRANMDAVLELADWRGFPARRRAAAKRGRLAGIGLANYVELPVGMPSEQVEVSVRAEGSGRRRRRHPVERTGARDELRPGARRQARRHAGAGAARDRRHRGGRRRAEARTPTARCGSPARCSSRRPPASSPRRARCSPRSRDAQRTRSSSPTACSCRRARTCAAMCSTSRAPSLTTPRCRRSCGRRSRARRASSAASPPIRPAPRCARSRSIRETGLVAISRYASVDDAGQPINPLILHGQVHGGIVQGAGQALCEAVIHDAAGEMLTGSFMDYAMPRAVTVPSFTVALTEDATGGNPLRVKGGGEAGVTPALAVVMNAVIDALAARGIEHLDMPATPSRVWEALRKVQGEAKT